MFLHRHRLAEPREPDALDVPEERPVVVRTDDVQLRPEADAPVVDAVEPAPRRD
jgi:hypothetical protein